MHLALVIKGLAAAARGGSWDADAIAARFGEALGSQAAWLKTVAASLCELFAEAPDQEQLERALRRDSFLQRRLAKQNAPVLIRRWFVSPVETEASPAMRFDLPSLRDEHDLASFLDLSPSELLWFADLRGFATDRLTRHYDSRWVAKRGGGHRLLERPRPRIKAMQRHIAKNILSALPVSEAAHGFVPGRSIHSFTAPHVGKRLVVRVDLASFFWSVSRARVAAMFRYLGYPSEVARLLAGVCTTRTAESALIGCPDRQRHFHTLALLRTPHLAQGAPSSPALANFACRRLDARLLGLARKHGAAFTRYADDMAFSFDRGEELHCSFIALAATIAREEGFALNPKKTRAMWSGHRQELTGLVLNHKASPRRRDIDRLQAILHNCLRDGPSAQNRERHRDFRAHLQGRIAWVRASNPHRGAKLEAMFAAIEWP